MQTVVITGANRGIGLALARAFAERGDRVIGGCRAPERAEELRAVTDDVHTLDVTSAESVAAFAAQLSNETVDVLINNAGINPERQGIEDMDYAGWEQALAVNTLGPFRVTTALLDRVKRSERPRIVTISSQMGSLARESVGYHSYRSSKAAVNKVMQVLAHELQADGVIVCPVHPGWVQTDMGGAEADLSMDESAAGLITLIDGLTIEQSGRFWTWDGREHPW